MLRRSFRRLFPIILIANMCLQHGELEDDLVAGLHCISDTLRSILDKHILLVKVSRKSSVSSRNFGDAPKVSLGLAKVSSDGMMRQAARKKLKNSRDRNAQQSTWRLSSPCGHIDVISAISSSLPDRWLWCRVTIPFSVYLSFLCATLPTKASAIEQLMAKQRRNTNVFIRKECKWH